MEKEWNDETQIEDKWIANYTSINVLLVINKSISSLPKQPYSSTRIVIQLYQAVGRKRMYLALIGGKRSWYTTVSLSVFPEKF